VKSTPIRSSRVQQPIGAMKALRAWT